MTSLKKQPYRILLTSVGSRVGQGLLYALESYRESLFVVGLNSVSRAPSLWDCDEAHLMEATETPAYEEQLCTLLKHHHPHVVIPCRDEELPVLSRLAATPAFSHIRFFAPPQNLLKAFTDKYQSSCFARKHGLPFAATAVDVEQLAGLLAASDFPLVAKPRLGGHGSKGTYLVQNRAQAHRALALGNYVLQALIQPETLQVPVHEDMGVPWISAINDVKYAVEVVIGPEGSLISLSAGRTYGNEWNNPEWTLVSDPQIIEVGQHYAEVLSRCGYRGVFNLQGKRGTTGELVVYEMNARFTGSNPVRTVMGYNQVLHGIQSFLTPTAPLPVHAVPNERHRLYAVKMPQYYRLISEEREYDES